MEVKRNGDGEKEQVVFEEQGSRINIDLLND